MTPLDAAQQVAWDVRAHSMDPASAAGVGVLPGSTRREAIVVKGDETMRARARQRTREAEEDPAAAHAQRVLDLVDRMRAGTLPRDRIACAAFFGDLAAFDALPFEDKWRCPLPRCNAVSTYRRPDLTDDEKALKERVKAGLVSHTAAAWKAMVLATNRDPICPFCNGNHWATMIHRYPGVAFVLALGLVEGRRSTVGLSSGLHAWDWHHHAGAFSGALKALQLGEDEIDSRDGWNFVSADDRAHQFFDAASRFVGARQQAGEAPDPRAIGEVGWLAIRLIQKAPNPYTRALAKRVISEWALSPAESVRSGG